MSNRTIALDDRLHEYLLRVSLREPEILCRLREETLALPDARMQIAPEQGQFMALLARLIGARRILEIGTFTGYSSLVLALALPADGRITTCDVSGEWTAVARRYWREAGVEDRIDLRLAPAADTIRRLLEDGAAGSFDFVFIDADKESTADYFDAAIELVRPGGLIAVDNALWSGRVADPAVHDEDTEAIRAFNERVRADTRVDLSLVPIGDGLALARRREAGEPPADRRDGHVPPRSALCSGA